MLASTRRNQARLLCSLTLVAALVALLIAASALANPTVTVRVEGLTETKLPATQVTTTNTPVVKDGNSEHSCSGTSAIGGLELATGGNWSGPWNSEFDQYEIYSIEGETHLFEPSSTANYYWSFWLDEKEATAGACEVQLQPGDRVLFFPACFGSSCPPEQTPLGIEAPEVANVGESIQVTVRRYISDGTSLPLAGAEVNAGAVSGTTDSEGHVKLSIPAAGEITLRASAPASVRTEASICVHAGNDGTCGTSTSTTGASSPTPTVATVTPPYKGPYALVAGVKGLADGHVYGPKAAPRLLSGTISAHAAVTSVKLELRREYKGRCSAYDGALERFRRAACGTGSFFQASTGGVFSYLLPSALAPGRYVLDIKATDAAGNQTVLARGTSRIVFYVR